MTTPEDRRFARPTDPVTLDPKTSAALVALREEKSLTVEQLAVSPLEAEDAPELDDAGERFPKGKPRRGDYLERAREEGPAFWDRLPLTILPTPGGEATEPGEAGD